MSNLLVPCEPAKPIVEQQPLVPIVMAELPAEIPPRPIAVVELEPAFARALSNRLVVMAILAVAGPIGLPALWLSRRFSLTTKAIISIAFLLFTVVFPLAMAYYWLEVSMRPLLDATSQALKKP